MPRSRLVDSPATLLAFLFAAFPENKKTQVRQWLKFGAVAVNGRGVRKFDHALHPGDTVSVQPTGQAAPETRLASGLVIRHEDDTLLVVEKPSGLLSVAPDSGQGRTAYAALTDHVRRGQAQNRARIWIVHRLDRETSGLMVFAKTEAAKRALQEHWEQTEKLYVALVEHAPKQPSGRIASHLNESKPGKVFSAPRGPETRHAITHYRTLEVVRHGTLLEVRLETGRRHQIRVHLADLLCPIVGDDKYGATTDPFARICLHAARLAFKHPTSGAALRFESSPPPAWRLAPKRLTLETRKVAR